MHFLSMAAANSAEVERLALGAGMKKGGAAKGELVLAMYELANCFRNGWGIKKDAAAAKQYYETAANLGDTDAMNELAWCYIEGFGTKKDKVRQRQCQLWRGVVCVVRAVRRLAPSRRPLAAARHAGEWVRHGRGGFSLICWAALYDDGGGGDGGGGGDDDDHDYDDDDDDDSGANQGVQFKAAQFLRLAESKGNKTLGNTW